MSTVASAKAELRTRIRAARGRISPEERVRLGEALRDVVLALPELTTARVVAAYVNASAEPPTVPLLAALAARGGCPVLLPVQCADGDLEWAWYDDAVRLTPGPHGIAEPSGRPLGRDAVADADVVLVPALAVDRSGNRLGQGGGGYDRALRRVAPGALTVALVYADELVEAVPAEPHDVPVRAAATPTESARFA